MWHIGRPCARSHPHPPRSCTRCPPTEALTLCNLVSYIGENRIPGLMVGYRESSRCKLPVIYFDKASVF
ncbi:hypothetical protein A0H81_13898 [Grifola frondosa]|uniref:Uncharacterized protein n=1 Tax=Grifola frondosa TaxID=5627 RepID=A0A1C7LTW6_GRIFR|nr:hypothetical protein A0H81_13898 [Grifola frondosa]